MNAQLRTREPLLFRAGALMVVGLLAAIVMAALDPRPILGINPWIKPIKFLISITMFLWTAAWFMSDTREMPRARATVRWVLVSAMFTEIVLIAFQAARGTTSHFNNSSVINSTIFSVMGIMITVNTAAMMLMLWTVRRDTPTNRAGYLWGVRSGIALFILASLQGFVLVANNAHAVPGPDGGPGLPFVNWSTTQGDLRIAHFFGLHALQALPLLGFVVDRGTGFPARTRRIVVLAAAVVWLVAMGGLLRLALQGHPLIGL